MGVDKDDPQAWTVDFVVTGANRASQLNQLKRRMLGMREIQFRVFGSARLKRWVNEEIHQHPASVIDEIAKTLGNQNRVDVARRRLFQLIEIVIGQRLVQWNFDRG